jgi:hypothetical protein
MQRTFTLSTLYLFLFLQLSACNDAETNTSIYRQTETTLFHHSKRKTLLGTTSIEFERYSLKAKEDLDSTLYYEVDRNNAFILSVPSGSLYVLHFKDFTLYLNSGTSLKVSHTHFTPNRDFQLLSGELYAELKSDDFISIYTKSFRLKERGSKSINVDSYSGLPMSNAVIITGPVALKSSVGTFHLSTNDMFSYNVETSKYNVSKCDGEEKSDWTQGWIRGSNVADLLTKICKFYGLHLNYNNVDLANIEGAFAFNWKFQTLENLLTALNRTIHLEIDMNDTSITVTDRNN